MGRFLDDDDREDYKNELLDMGYSATQVEGMSDEDLMEEFDLLENIEEEDDDNEEDDIDDDYIENLMYPNGHDDDDDICDD